MKYRHLGNYPPYSYLAAITFTGRNEQLVKDGVAQAAKQFRQHQILKVLGPSELVRQNDMYRYRIILKSKDRQGQKDLIWQWFNKLQSERKSYDVLIDVDPYVID